MLACFYKNTTTESFKMLTNNPFDNKSFLVFGMTIADWDSVYRLYRARQEKTPNDFQELVRFWSLMKPKSPTDCIKLASEYVKVKDNESYAKSLLLQHIESL